MADAFTDYMLGAPAQEWQPVRAVADSGYGSSAGNAMEMLNWINKDSAAMGTMSVPVMRMVNGRRAVDFSAFDTYGLWCKKSLPVAGAQPNPRNVVPYGIHDTHFAIAALVVPNIYNTGTAFHASNSMEALVSEIGLYVSQPMARFQDKFGQIVEILAPDKLPVNTAAVVSITCVPGAQRLRVNSAVAGMASATFQPGGFDQMLIGSGFQYYYPRPGFGGSVFSVVTGRGAPTTQELVVMERYLGSTAGI
jgi:endoglucanase